MDFGLEFFDFSLTLEYWGAKLCEGPYIENSIFIFIPSISISVRRLHDVGKSGWTILYILIPVIGVIWLFALFSRDTMPERNKWGGNPNLRGF